MWFTSERAKVRTSFLDRDLFAIPPEDIGQTRLLATFVDGVQVRADRPRGSR